jgi:hypothetical protein
MLCVFCERDSSGTTVARSVKVMERIARRERGRSPREAARPKEFCEAKFN